MMNINISAAKWQHMQQMAAIGELTTGIVHDLKNQLACIGVNVNMVEALAGNENVDKYFKNISRQIGYTNEMINLMLRMGTADVAYSTFDLAALMEDVATFFERVSGRGITIKTFVDESSHLISGCQSLISNSILNLCANARDAIGETGTIEVSLKRDFVKEINNDLLKQNINGECSILTVRDTGCGISADKLNQIFDPFFTTKSADTANTGLGLPNVIHTAREHGVGMTVESEVGTGTTFTLYFKAAA